MSHLEDVNKNKILAFTSSLTGFSQDLLSLDESVSPAVVSVLKEDGSTTELVLVNKDFLNSMEKFFLEKTPLVTTVVDDEEDNTNTSKQDSLDTSFDPTQFPDKEAVTANIRSGILNLENSLFTQASRTSNRLERLNVAVDTIEHKILDAQFLQTLPPPELIAMYKLVSDNVKSRTAFLLDMHKIAIQNKEVLRTVLAQKTEKETELSAKEAKKNKEVLGLLKLMLEKNIEEK